MALYNLSKNNDCLGAILAGLTSVAFTTGHVSQINVEEITKEKLNITPKPQAKAQFTITRGLFISCYFVAFPERNFKRESLN